MLCIRFLRTGKKNQPFFRIVVTDKKNPPRGGRFLEIVGFFNPFTKEKRLKAERIKYWLSVGAQPSDRVHNMLVQEGIIKEKKKSVHAKKKVKEGETASEPAAVPVAAKAPVSEAPAKSEPVSTPALVDKPVEPKPAEEKEKPKPKPAEDVSAKEEKPAAETKKEEVKPTEEPKPEEKPAKLEPPQQKS